MYIEWDTADWIKYLSFTKYFNIQKTYNYYACSGSYEPLWKWKCTEMTEVVEKYIGLTAILHYLMSVAMVQNNLYESSWPKWL